MITRVFGLVVNGGVYFLAATLLTQILLGVYLWKSWEMNEQRLMRMLAVAQGIDLLAHPEQPPSDRDPSAEQPSLEQIIRERAGKIRDIEKRELELRNTKALLVAEQLELVRERDGFTTTVAAFEQRLRDIEEGALQTGRSRDLRTFSGLKPKQAKELLMAMLQEDEIEDVVILMAAMSARSQGKIIAEFKTFEEIEQIREVLKRIRYGEPEITAAQNTLDQLALFAPGT